MNFSSQFRFRIISYTIAVVFLAIVTLSSFVFFADSASTQPAYAVALVRDPLQSQNTGVHVIDEQTTRLSFLPLPNALFIEKGPMSGLLYVLEGTLSQGGQLLTPSIRRFQLPTFTEAGTAYVLPSIGIAASSTGVSALHDMELNANETQLYIGHRDAIGAAPLVGDALTIIQIGSQGFTSYQQLSLGFSGSVSAANPITIAYPPQGGNVIAVGHTRQSGAFPAMPAVSLIETTSFLATVLVTFDAPPAASGYLRDLQMTSGDAWALFSPSGLSGSHIVRRISLTPPNTVSSITIPASGMLLPPAHELEAWGSWMGIGASPMQVFHSGTGIVQCTYTPFSFSQSAFGIEFGAGRVAYLRIAGTGVGGVVVGTFPACGTPTFFTTNGLVAEGATLRAQAIRTSNSRYYIYSSRSGPSNSVLYLNFVPLFVPTPSFSSMTLRTLPGSPTAFVADMDAYPQARREALP